MHAEGVVVHPLVQSTGEAEFNEVELDDVFVPTDRRVGPEGEGWGVAGSTLAHERGINPRQLVIHTQLIEELLRLAEANGELRRLAAAPVTGPGRHRGPAVPAAQLALADPPLQGGGARPRRQRAQAVLE